jgi:starch phosphorylase
MRTHHGFFLSQQLGNQRTLLRISLGAQPSLELFDVRGTYEFVMAFVGTENFFLFGLNAAEVDALRRDGYRPRDYCERDAELRTALEAIASGEFSAGDRELYRPLLDHLLEYDDYMLLADFRSYVDAQAQVERAFADQAMWTRMSILNVARAGRFSSDRAIREYCSLIWDVKPVPISLQQ